MSVMTLAIHPPVQDSAVLTVSPRAARFEPTAPASALRLASSEPLIAAPPALPLPA
jgi:hypothetical protein